jgi:gliding motility-associated-like protein
MKKLKSSFQKIASSFFVYTLISLGLFSGAVKAQSQLPECQSSVPFFNLNLSADPDSTYVTPEITRNGQCCGASSSQNFVSFYVTLHPDVAMVEIGIMPGYADPGGSGNYIIVSGGDLNTPGVCGTPIPGGTTTCITGVGPHKITYFKPGSNKVKYYLKQIPKPIFPFDDSTRVDCQLPLNIYGLNNIQITSINSSTGNTTPGAYNSLLSCTNCPSPIFSPGLSTPTWIDYVITGTPQASSVCGTYTTTDTVRLYTFPKLNASVTPNPASFCSGGGGVTLTASATGGLAPYSYTWRNSSNVVVGTGATYHATAQGTYTVEVTDQLSSTSCYSTFISVPVTVGNPPVVNAGTDDTVCAQSPTVFLQGSVQFASGGIWTGGAGVYTPSNTSLIATYMPTSAEINAGFVTLTLTSTGAGGGCTNSSDQVTFYFSDTIYVNPSAVPIVCSGNTTTISANASGGTAPLTYMWSTGATTSSINAPAGTYSVMVMDAVGCVKSANITVVDPAPLLLNLSSTNTSTDLACDGNATVVISGGLAPYTILWSNGDATTTTNNTLCYGIVTVTVTDASGCVVTGSVVVNKPSCALFNVTASNTNLLCYGDANATATAAVVGGTAPYSYVWNTVPAQTGPDASGLTIGTYTVTVTDDNGCIDVASVTVTQPSAITNTMTYTNATSIGGTNGTATANPAGGIAPYTYAWNTTPPQNTQTATGLAAGVYQVVITDDNNCTFIDSVLINQPPCNNFILAVTATDVTCFGANNGAASLLIAHGTAPYDIVWSSGHINVTSVSGLAAGNYNVTVTDASNCTTFQTFSITEPAELTLSLAATNITCNGASDGTIDITLSGGTFPYTYAWYSGANLIAIHEDLINMGPGTYSVVVTDANNCSVSGSTGVTQPGKLSVNFTSVDVTCNGDSNGSIDVTPTGGTMPYTYSWTGPGSYTNNTQDISGLAFGLYELTITDGSNCNLQSPLQVYINQPDTVVIRHVAVPCPAAGATTVTVNVDTITGGAGTPYQVSFDNGITFQASGIYTATLALGNTYQLVARDSNGCLSPVFNLVLNPSVVIDSVVFNRCIPTGNTTIPVTVYPNGGDGGPYQVSTDGGVTFGLAGTYLFNLNVNNNYNIVVRDTNGCISLATNITIPAELIATAVQSAQVTCLGGSDGAINLTVTGGTTAYSYAWIGPGTYTNNIEDISGLQAGVYNVTVTDAFGCTAAASATVTTVPDITNPTILCPSNISVQNNVGICGAAVTYATPVGLDNCPGASTVLTAGLASGAIFPVGLTTVTYTVTDTVGNTASCSFTVTVSDTTRPVISGCPANIIVNNDLNTCGAVVNWTAPTASDNCAVTSFTSNFNPGATFPVGTTTVTYTASDAAGNNTSCSFTVTVNDTTYPVISNCPTNITAYSVSNQCGVNVSWAAPTATDNCGTVTTTATHAPNTFFVVGTTTVTYTFTDAANNASTCSFLVTVIDTINPVISNCPSNISVSNNGTACGNTVTWTAPTAADNCGIASFTTSYNPGSFFPVGTTTVTYTATDVNSNISTCSFTVTVSDTTKPVVANCPSNVTVYSAALACGNTATWAAPTATDNCGTVITSSTHNPGDFFPVGTTTVTYTFTDAASNNATCSFNVIVIDTIKPVINACPSNIIVSNNLNVCNAVVTWAVPTVTDNCGVVNMTSTHNPGDVFPVGTTTVTYTAIDQYNNTSICSFTVTVNDTTMPVFVTCPSNITVSNNGAQCGNTVTWTAPTATDNCGTTTITTTHNPGSFFAVGSHTVTYTATDNAGNSSTCSFIVTVNDTTKPFVSACPANIVVYSTALACGNTVSWTPPTAIDNCDGAITPVASHNPGDFFTVGTTIVTYTFTDAANNSSICNFTVTVLDSVKPIIANCPSNISVFNDAGQCGASVTWVSPTATDNCGTVTTISTHNSGDFFALGTTQVGYTFTDASGNSVTCNFTVTVTDNETPVITSCPSDITVANDAGQCGAIVSWTPPSATDNCTLFTVTSTHTPGSFFNVGTTTVTYTVTDNVNNVSTCSFDVIVDDTEIPQITCAPAIASCDSNITYAAPVVLDNCAVSTVVLTSGIGSGNIYPVGTTADIYTVTDIHGNINTCSVSVTVHPTPEVLLSVTDVACFGDSTGVIDATINSGTPSFTYLWSNGETTEDITGLTPGVYSLTVTDANACSSSAVATVSQPDKIILTAVITEISCNRGNNGAIDISVTGGVAPYTYSWSNGSTDEDIFSLTAGSYSITVTDANNCSETNVITLIEPAPLVVTSTSVPATCQAPNGIVDITISGGTVPYAYSWSNGSTNQDLIGVATGTYTVTVTDANACEISYTDSVASISNMQLTAVVKNALCYKDASGSIDLSPSHGLSPYSFAWSNGATTEDLSELLADTYTVTVTDANQCTITETYVITESDSLYVELTSPIYHGTNNVSTYGGSDGSIDLTVFGGTAPYTYSWSNGLVIEDISGLPAGTYSVVVTDANGCTAYGIIELKQPDDIELPEGFSPNGDGKNDYFVIKGIEAYTENDFVVYNRWGNVVYEKSGYANEWDGRNNSGSELPDGTYFVILKIAAKDNVYKGYVDLRRK